MAQWTPNAQWNAAWAQGYPRTPVGGQMYIPVSPTAPGFAYWSQPAWVSYAPPPPSNAPAAGYYPVPPGYARDPRTYPELHPILAGDVSQLPSYDVRWSPKDTIPTEVYNTHGRSYAVVRSSFTSAPLTHLRLISKDFPWSIDIRVPSPSQPITVQSVWEALHRGLQGGLEDSEWGMVVLDDNHIERMSFASKKRKEKEGREAASKPKRVDWLGDSTIFRGLVRDAEFEKRRLLPGAEKCPETWVVKFGVRM